MYLAINISHVILKFLFQLAKLCMYTYSHSYITLCCTEDVPYYRHNWFHLLEVYFWWSNSDQWQADTTDVNTIAKRKWMVIILFINTCMWRNIPLLQNQQDKVLLWVHRLHDIEHQHQNWHPQEKTHLIVHQWADHSDTLHYLNWNIQDCKVLRKHSKQISYFKKASR